MSGICAGIVLYEPNLERLKENIGAVYNQVEKLYLVDNFSSNINAVCDLISEQSKAVIIKNGENCGIARALNQLCNAALKDGYEWMLTLDQDSVADTSMIADMLPVTKDQSVALIAPFVNDDYENEEGAKDLTDTEEITRCNTSGSLTRLSVFKEIGGFDERMFIDCVDFDYCTRLLKNGYRVVRVNSAVIHHRLGQASPVRFFVPFGKLFGIKKLQKPFYTYNHSPLRTYYYARNILYYMYKHKDFINMKQEKRTYLRWFVLKVFFEKQGFKKLCAIIKGTVHSKRLKNEYKKEISR
ncbi:MAG: glycosyltransferase family 2 protein [Clostridia bacterium]|nr:glycosyltransferase family 2 protein [Clostridia bacterium]